MMTIILPGMGANSNMYPKEKYNSLENVIFAEWPVYEGEDTIGTIARKIIDQYQINSEMVVGGSSFGGIVAIEIAKTIGINKAILIGSATDPACINPLLKKLSNLAEITPFQFIQALTGTVNRYMNSELLQMFEESDSEFIRAMCTALFKWEGLCGFACDIHHIHGEKDLVIFPPRQNVKIIPGGGHLISITHAEEVASFINENKG